VVGMGDPEFNADLMVNFRVALAALFASTPYSVSFAQKLLTKARQASPLRFRTAAALPGRVVSRSSGRSNNSFNPTAR
jgi:hypothetical protein